MQTPPAIVVGTSAGATIAVDLAIRRPDLVRAVISHEAAWRAARHMPTPAQAVALAKVGALALIGRSADAAETLLRFVYSYPDGGTAWDWFPEAWRQSARENARPALADFRNSVGNYPTPADLAHAIPSATTHRIEGTGHAAPFDATASFVQLIADTLAIAAT